MKPSDSSVRLASQDYQVKRHQARANLAAAQQKSNMARVNGYESLSAPGRSATVTVTVAVGK